MEQRAASIAASKEEEEESSVGKEEEVKSESLTAELVILEKMLGSIRPSPSWVLFQAQSMFVTWVFLGGDTFKLKLFDDDDEDEDDSTTTKR